MINKNVFNSAIIFFLFFGFFSQLADASIKLKVSASNPSELSEQKVSVKSYLPRGIRPEGVLDAGGLEIGYDVKKGQCYVHKDVVLPPKGTASYQVEIEDIWLIPPEELEKQRNYAYKLRDQLKSSEYVEMAQKITVEIEEKISAVISRQEENSIDKVTPIDHIGAYEQNQEVINEIKENISILENMIITLLKAGTIGGLSGGKIADGGKSFLRRSVKESGPSLKSSHFGLTESPEKSDVDKSSDIAKKLARMRAGSCISQEAVRYANGQNISLDAPENITLTVGVENPSSTANQTVPARYYLSQEVKVSDVLDSGGLNIGFDFEKSLYYVFKDDVLLEPGETKSFLVVLRNKWIIDKYYLLTLKVHSDSVAMSLGRHGTSTAKEKNDEIQKQLDELLGMKGASELTEDYLKTFRDGQQKLQIAEEKIHEMEDTVVSLGIVDVMTSEAKEKLCEDDRDRKIIASAKGSEMVKEFKMVASTIFKGQAPKTTTTWELISGIVLFLGVISASFYYTQIKEQKSAMLDNLTGSFSRGYITERFREELKIALNTKGKCSLLVMDIDKFKSINDTRGHSIGDAVLKEFVIALRKGVRATDLVGRFGGDEFLIVLPTSDKERAVKIADGIVKIVSRHTFTIKNQTLNTTTSIGVATYPDDSKTAEDMFIKADAALYQVKRKGWNGAASA